MCPDILDLPPAWLLAGLALRWQPSPALDWPAGAADGYWESAADLARSHGVAGPLYQQALAHPALFPAELAHLLGLGCSLYLLAIDHWQTHLCHVLEALAAAEVPVMVLKGWALVAGLYDGDASRRPAGDLDLLVPPSEARRAQAVLDRLGYTLRAPELWPGFALRYGSELEYSPASPGDPPFVVDLHWRPLGLPYDRFVSVEDWLARARPARLAGVEIRVPAPEDHLVYLCAHLALHHRYALGLRSYHDVAVLIHAAGDALDWDAVASRAAAWRLLIPLQCVLAHVEALWPGALPAAVRDVARLSPSSAESGVYSRAVGADFKPLSVSLLRLAALPGLARRAGFLLESTFPSPAHMRWRYGQRRPHAWPLYYLVRAGITLRRLSEHIPP